MDSRLECRFEHGDCVIHSPTTGPSTHRGLPALCSHAAAALERHVQELYEQARILTADQTTKANRIMDLERRVDDLESSLADLERDYSLLEQRADEYCACAARLEEEKAQAEEERNATVGELDALLREARAERDEAEAREAAMRLVLKRLWENCVAWGLNLYAQAEISQALSPTAGRTQEVK